MTSETASDPRSEARDRAGDGYDARVLEPSPPAVLRGPWFADDPVARDDAAGPVVSPLPGGDLTWAQRAAGDDELAAWCRERWLGPHRALGELPSAYTATRLALHAVAEQVVAKARERACGKFGLRWVRGGFGTPFFGDDVQVSVKAAMLHVVRGATRTSTPLTSLAAAERAVGGPAQLDEAPLDIDDGAARAIGDWFGFSTSVLEELRAGEGAAHAPSRVQLWPEHFDPAVELGDEAAGTRAAYGCSPGDDAHPKPYLYVAPWTATPAGELWKADGFAGAQLDYAELLAAEDQRALALEFFAARLRALS